MRELRIGFITGRQLIARDGRIHADPGVTRVVNRLAEQFPGLILAGTSSEPTNLLTEAVDLPDDDIYFMPEMTSFLRGTRLSRVCSKVIGEVERRCDIVVVQLAIQAPLALLPVRGPRVYHLYSDVLGMAQGSVRYQGIRRFPTLALGFGVDRLHDYLVNRDDARVITNGEPLFRHHGGRGDWVVSATVSIDEINSVERKRPHGDPPRVLFVGYLRYEKGVDTLLAAWPAIRERWPNATLHIVGPGTPEGLGAQTARVFHDAVATAGVLHRGSLQFGPELFQEYADADVLVLPSRSEGTPRVLIEARAFGCPVVTTPVGGIPSSVIDGIDGLLVAPDAPQKLADAVNRLLGDDNLRASLIEAGSKRALDSTVESFADSIADQISLLGLDVGFTPPQCP